MSADLLFTRAATGSTDLLFGASDAPDVVPMPVRLALDTGGPSLALRLARATPATMVVMDVTGSPLVSMNVAWDSNTYTHISEASATLWPEGDALPLFECSIETDAGGYGWHLRASGPAQLMEMLAPRADGTPVRVRVEVCGMAWVFVVGLRQRKGEAWWLCDGLHRLAPASGVDRCHPDRRLAVAWGDRMG